MNNTMSGHKRLNGCIQRVCFLCTPRMSPGQHLLLYRGFQLPACGICSCRDNPLRVLLFSPYMLVPSGISLMLDPRVGRMLGQLGASTDRQLVLYVRIGRCFCVGNGVNIVFWGKKDCISWVETKQKASRGGLPATPEAKGKTIFDRLAPRARSTAARQNPRPKGRGGFILCQFFDNRTCILLSDLHFICSVVFDEIFDLQFLVRR